MRPLDNITVLALEHAVAAPIATRQLADLGAEVIKIERPGVGDFSRGYDGIVRGQSAYFVWLNRGKKSVTLDVKHPDAAPLLQALVARADVLVQNLAPGAAQRLGLGYAELSSRHPGLIVCDVSGYGDAGPYRDKKAYDLLIQAEAGLISTTGTEDAPMKAGVSIADIAAGQYAFGGILAALVQRGRTGRGTRVQVTMFEALTEWMTYSMYAGHYGGRRPPRNGMFHPSLAPYGPHRAGDGKLVLFGMQNDREWAVFAREVLERPELAADPDYATNVKRVANRNQLTRIIEQAFAPFTAEQVLARLDRAHIANARINDMLELWDHPQLAARGRWREVATPAGVVPALLPPLNLGDDEPAMGNVPALGEHTDAVLSGLGIDSGRIATLRAAGAI